MPPGTEVHLRPPGSQASDLRRAGGVPSVRRANTKRSSQPCLMAGPFLSRPAAVRNPIPTEGTERGPPRRHRAQVAGGGLRGGPIPLPQRQRPSSARRGPWTGAARLGDVGRSSSEPDGLPSGRPPATCAAMSPEAARSVPSVGSRVPDELLDGFKKTSHEKGWTIVLVLALLTLGTPPARRSRRPGSRRLQVNSSPGHFPRGPLARGRRALAAPRSTGGGFQPGTHGSSLRPPRGGSSPRRSKRP